MMHGEAARHPEGKTSAEAIRSPIVVDPTSARNLDRLLDEALKDSFPASDPPSVLMPS